jgi:hypothetical protein
MIPGLLAKHPQIIAVELLAIYGLGLRELTLRYFAHGHATYFVYHTVL